MPFAGLSEAAQERAYQVRQKATKTQEFVAHGTGQLPIVGRRSAMRARSGGDDKKVNIWSVGKPTAIMSLAGHTSAIGCVVTFDREEQTVIVRLVGRHAQAVGPRGGQGGAHADGPPLELRRRAVAPVRRVLRVGLGRHQPQDLGHPPALVHPDVRGHSRAVRQSLFSPDGRWVISGGDDGLVKVWDLTIGRLVHEFDQDSGAIAALAIHPAEFLLASASTDRTMRLWDLETFQPVCQTPHEQSRCAAPSSPTTAARSSAAPTRRSRCGAGRARPRRHDVARPNGAKLADMTIAPDGKIVAGSTRDALVAVWSLDLALLKPFRDDPAPPAARRPPLARGRAPAARRHRPAAALSAAPASPASLRPPPTAPPLRHDNTIRQHVGACRSGRLEHARRRRDADADAVPGARHAGAGGGARGPPVAGCARPSAARAGPRRGRARAVASRGISRARRRARARDAVVEVRRARRPPRRGSRGAPCGDGKQSVAGCLSRRARCNTRRRRRRAASSSLGRARAPPLLRRRRRRVARPPGARRPRSSRRSANRARILAARRAPRTRRAAAAAPPTGRGARCRARGAVPAARMRRSDSARGDFLLSLAPRRRRALRAARRARRRARERRASCSHRLAEAARAARGTARG